MRHTSFSLFPLAIALGACSSSVALDGGADTVDVTLAADVTDTPVPNDVPAVFDTRDESPGVDAIDARRPFDARPDRPVIYTPDVAVSCGTMSCNSGQVCCGSVVGGAVSLTCMDSCVDASVTISCSGPENCAGNPCCADLSVGGGGGPIGSVSCTATPDACIPTVNLATRSGQTRLCHSDADCAPSVQLPTCCTIVRGDLSEHVCLNTAVIGLLPGTTCP